MKIEIEWFAPVTGAGGTLIAWAGRRVLIWPFRRVVHLHRESTSRAVQPQFDELRDLVINADARNNAAHGVLGRQIAGVKQELAETREDLRTEIAEVRGELRGHESRRDLEG